MNTGAIAGAIAVGALLLNKLKRPSKRFGDESGVVPWDPYNKAESVGMVVLPAGLGLYFRPGGPDPERPEKPIRQQYRKVGSLRVDTEVEVFRVGRSRVAYFDALPADVRVQVPGGTGKQQAPFRFVFWEYNGLEDSYHALSDKMLAGTIDERPPSGVKPDGRIGTRVVFGIGGLLGFAVYWPQGVAAAHLLGYGSLAGSRDPLEPMFLTDSVEQVTNWSVNGWSRIWTLLRGETHSLSAADFVVWHQEDEDPLDVFKRSSLYQYAVRGAQDLVPFYGLKVELNVSLDENGEVKVEDPSIKGEVQQTILCRPRALRVKHGIGRTEH